MKKLFAILLAVLMLLSLSTAAFAESGEEKIDMPFPETGISFQTTDFDGNPVSSEEIFAANRITMLNIWETGCGPCKGELGELAQIHKRFQQMGCGIVGLLYDSDSQKNINTARQLLQNAGASYPSITCPSNFDDLFDLQDFPTSYFIDSQGRILGSPVVGAQVD